LGQPPSVFSTILVTAVFSSRLPCIVEFDMILSYLTLDPSRTKGADNAYVARVEHPEALRLNSCDGKTEHPGARIAVH